MNLSERQETTFLTQLYFYITSYIMTNVLSMLACSISALSCRCRMASMTTIFIGLCEYLMNFFPAQISVATLLIFARTSSWKKRLFYTQENNWSPWSSLSVSKEDRKSELALRKQVKSGIFGQTAVEYWTYSAANLRHICTFQSWVMRQSSHKRLAWGIHISITVMCHAIVHHAKTLEWNWINL